MVNPMQKTKKTKKLFSLCVLKEREKRNKENPPKITNSEMRKSLGEVKRSCRGEKLRELPTLRDYHHNIFFFSYKNNISLDEIGFHKSVEA